MGRVILADAALAAQTSRDKMGRDFPRMRTAILHGYYGEQNAGDDAFVLISAWAARRFLGCERVYARADSLPAQHGTHLRRMFVSMQRRGGARLNWLRELWISRTADVLVWGGGSIFHSTPTLERYLRALDRAGAGPHCAVGVSIGPFRDPSAEATCARVLERLDFVGVRDQASLARGQAIAPRAALELTFDLAPLLPEACGASGAARAPRRGLGIALCGLARASAEEQAVESARVRAVAEAVRTILGRGAVDELLLIDLNGHSDAAAHRALADALPAGTPLRHLPYADDPLATWQTIAGLRALVAMRLHAAVFGFCAGTPTAVLAYHEKCWQWAETIGADRSLVCDAAAIDPGGLASAVERLLSGAAPPPRLDPRAAVLAARRNFAFAGAVTRPAEAAF
jgi:polysaccharide pyruvyl transferase WcaK-like protein